MSKAKDSTDISYSHNSQNVDPDHRKVFEAQNKSKTNRKLRTQGQDRD